MTRLNITFDPAEPARAVKDLEIGEVRTTRTGLVLDAPRLIASRRYDRLVRIRNLIREEMQRDSPRFLCAICATPVYLVATKVKAFFFRDRVQDGSCPAQNSGKASEGEIRAMKYQGARESDAHRRIKALVARGLDADPRIMDVRAEKVWQSMRDPDAWRKPDVQATR